MSTFNAILISTIAGMSTLLGSLVIFLNINKEKINEFITLCLSFSIAIMIGISITDLIPNSFFNIMLNYSFYKGVTITLLSFGLGFILVWIINKLMSKSNDSLYKLGILSMIALMLHNFPEGIATFMGSVKDTTLGIKLAIAIMLHNIPEGISIAVPIYYATNSKKKAFFNTLLSGIAEPLGAIITYLILNHYVTDLMLNITLLLVAGIMITLSIQEMFPKVLKYHKDKYIYLGLIFGILIIIINHFIL